MIFEWCRLNRPKGSKRIGNMMPLFNGGQWTDFAIDMIDEFGADENFLGEIAANLGSFSMVGSSEHYFQRIIDMAKTLKDHKFPQVRKWAKSCILYYQKQIRREQLDEEQRN